MKWSYWWAKIQSWWTRRKSQEKHSHRKRQNYSKRLSKKLNNIDASNDLEKFAKSIAYLRKIDPLIFEELILDAFEKHGYPVKRNYRYTGDGGLDGEVYYAEQWCGVQCKRYKGHIKTSHVREFRATLERAGRKMGFFIHTGVTPLSARKELDSFARDEIKIIIISGQKLINFISKN